MKLREHGPAFCNRPLDTPVLNLGWCFRQCKWSQDKTSIPRRRWGNVIAAEVTVTSKRKMRSCKGAEPEWKQTLSCKCLKEVLQKGQISWLLLSFWIRGNGWNSGYLGIKWFPSHYFVPQKALSANEGLLFIICSAVQKSFNVCLLLQGMVWVSVVMPTDCAVYSLLRRELSFFSLSPFQGEKHCIISLVPHRMME